MVTKVPPLLATLAGAIQCFPAQVSHAFEKSALFVWCGNQVLCLASRSLCFLPSIIINKNADNQFFPINLITDRMASTQSSLIKMIIYSMELVVHLLKHLCFSFLYSHCHFLLKPFLCLQSCPFNITHGILMILFLFFYCLFQSNCGGERSAKTHHGSKRFERNTSYPAISCSMAVFLALKSSISRNCTCAWANWSRRSSVTNLWVLLSSLKSLARPSMVLVLSSLKFFNVSSNSWIFTSFFLTSLIKDHHRYITKYMIWLKNSISFKGYEWR